MLPYLELFGRQIPSYGALAALGVLLGLLLVLLYCRRFGLEREDCAFLYVFGAIGAVIGAKLLYLLTIAPQLVQGLPLLWQNPIQFIQHYLSGGLVFYGGLVGAIVGAALCARYFSLRLRDYFPVFVPVFPLIHAIGRVGCFAAGCCYGMEADWGLAFTDSLVAPNGVKLIPIQLFEAGAEVLICLILLWYVVRHTKWHPKPLRLLSLYFLLYAPVRFVLEFFRGDVVRGFLWSLSTSQWISILIFLAGIILWVMTGQAQKKQ